MLKTIVAIVAGLFTASLIVMLFDSLPAMVYTIPMNGGMPDLSSVPLGAMLLVAAGWAVAPLAGGAVAMWLGGEKGTYCMWAVAALFAIVVIINLLQFHHPVWMWVVGILAPVPAALLGGRLIKRR